MSKIHILTADNNGNYRVALHATMPGGNNSAGTSWQQCWTASGRNVTILPVGNGPGEISASENTAITNGTVYEVVTTLRPSATPSPAELTELADIKLAEAASRLATEFKYFGHEQG